MHIFFEKRVIVLCAKLAKALYGTLYDALSFWGQLTETLKEWGISLNAYNRCVTNKTFNGHQFTIVWHVYGLLNSHVHEKVVNYILNKLNYKYGMETP
jgi:hypothetical protein